MAKKQPHDDTIARSENWFVEPSTDRLDLGGGFWVEVKKELTAGEIADINNRLVKSARAGMTGNDVNIEPDLTIVWKLQICAHLVAWNLTRGGKLVPYSEDAVNGLSQGAWRRIESAVQAHIEAMEVSRLGKPGGSTSSSGSPSAV